MLSHNKPGRLCELIGLPEISDLHAGMDFRNPQYRREVFLRFYEFHLKYKAHPGAVYYMMPHLAKKMGLTQEQKLWLGYINGCSQNILSTWVIFNEFPEIPKDVGQFDLWFREHYPKLGWDTDRRYVKNQFPTCIENYKQVLAGRTQEEFFGGLTNSDDPYHNFRRTWEVVMRDFYLFGRLATFSYLEYLRILGVFLDCDQLFMNDMNGSKSHRNGLCKVLGRDDLDWHDKLNPEFDGCYTAEVVEWLEKEGDLLLSEARKRIGHIDVSYFTLESTLCCYKSWHRKNRRYPNVYNDMFYNRIKYAEEKWGQEKDFTLFWDARKLYLPVELRLEDNPNDVGVKPAKQNHYLETGQVIMMSHEWDCFKSDYDSKFLGVGSSLETFFAK